MELDYLSILFKELDGSSVSESTLIHISQIIALKKVGSNQLLIRPGKVCNHAYFVLSGGFICRYVDENRDIAKTINFYLPDLHPFMSCIDSYFSQLPTQCELRAITDSVVLMMSKKDIDQLMSLDENLKKFYQSIVIRALIEENDLKLKIIAYPSEVLYHYLITELPSVIQKVPSKYIAEFMGISAEWLSKLKKKV